MLRFDCFSREFVLRRALLSNFEPSLDRPPSLCELRPLTGHSGSSASFLPDRPLFSSFELPELVSRVGVPVSDFAPRLKFAFFSISSRSESISKGL